MEERAPSHEHDDPRHHRCLVLEDADHYPTAQKGKGVGPAFSRLLNAAGGLIGQDRLIVLITTNLPEPLLQSAMVHPGRCLASIQFDLFEPDDARTWLGGTGSALAARVSLAERYERRGDIARISGGKRDVPCGQYL